MDAIIHKVPASGKSKSNCEQSSRLSSSDMTKQNPKTGKEGSCSHINSDCFKKCDDMKYFKVSERRKWALKGEEHLKPDHKCCGSHCGNKSMLWETKPRKRKQCTS